MAVPAPVALSSILVSSNFPPEVSSGWVPHCDAPSVGTPMSQPNRSSTPPPIDENGSRPEGAVTDRKAQMKGRKSEKGQVVSE